jgi:endonuclease G
MVSRAILLPFEASLQPAFSTHALPTTPRDCPRGAATTGHGLLENGGRDPGRRQQQRQLGPGQPERRRSQHGLAYQLPTYTVGYNRDQGKPIWVSWHLGASDLGSAAQQDDFRADESLPSGWYQVKMSDYSSSGFDRGHNCPSADRTATVADNSATFLMSNMMPQSPNNNQQTWGNLEDYCRTLVRAGNELYIVCGSYGWGGTGSAGYQTTIASGRVTVPSNCWKVMVVLPTGNNDVSRVTNSTRVIAINTPNNNSLNSA